MPEFLKRVGPDAFVQQCIPLDDGLREVEQYKGFIVARRVTISKRLNAYLGEPPAGSSGKA